MRAMSSRVAKAMIMSGSEEELRARAQFLEHQLRRERERVEGLECALLEKQARLESIARLLDEIAEQAARAAHFTVDARAELLLTHIVARALSVKAA